MTCFIEWLVDWLVDSSIHCLIDSLWFIHLFLPAFIHWFIVELILELLLVSKLLESPAYSYLGQEFLLLPVLRVCKSRSQICAAARTMFRRSVGIISEWQTLTQLQSSRLDQTFLFFKWLESETGNGSWTFHEYGDFLKWDTPKWLVCNRKSHLEIDDDWGYSHLWKPPYRRKSEEPFASIHRSTWAWFPLPTYMLPVGYLDVPGS